MYYGKASVLKLILNHLGEKLSSGVFILRLQLLNISWWYLLVQYSGNSYQTLLGNLFKPRVSIFAYFYSQSIVNILVDFLFFIVSTLFVFVLFHFIHSTYVEINIVENKI